MHKLLIICTTIFFNCALYSQNSDSVYNIAIKSFANGDTLLALKEIQRSILFDTISDNPQKYITAAQLFAYAGYHNVAEEYINQAYQKSKYNLHHNEVLIAKANIYIAEKKYFNALSTLLQIETDESEETFAIVQQHKAEIEELMHQTNKKRKPSPLTAGISSALIPGLGQYLSGKPLDGISSEVLVGSFVALGIYLAKNYGNWTAILCVLPWIQRYYIGGIKNAVDCARNKRNN